MKLTKTIVVPLSLSLFSTLILGAVTVQQVKAATDNSDQIQTSSDSLKTDTPLQTDPTPETQNITLHFVDDQDNPVVNSANEPYTISEEKNTGDTIVPSSLADQIKSDLNDGYEISDNNSDTIIQKDNNDYTIKLTPRTYKISIASNTDSYSFNSSLTVGQEITAVYGENGSTVGTDVSKLSFNGYGFSYLVYGSDGDIIPNTTDGKLKITYDMLPKLKDNYNAAIPGYQITAYYKQPLDQTITLKHVDDLGNEIPNTTDETITGHKTGDIITDPYSLATVKDISGYTYLRTTQPYTVSDNNTINLVYAKDDVNYLKVNYTDQSANKVIYTDYLRGNVGDSVTVKDISSVDGYNNFKMVDQSTAGSYVIKQDNETLNVNVSEKDPFIIVLNQNAGNLALTTELVTKFGNSVDISQLTYLSDSLTNVDSLKVDYNEKPQTLTKENLESFSQNNITTLSQLFEALTSPDGTALTVSDGENGLSGKTMELTVNYDTENIHITYQTEDGTIITTKDLNASDSTTNISDLVKNNLPTDYSLVDQNTPYSIGDTTDNSINLISIVKKTTDSNDTGGSTDTGSSTDNSNDSSGSTNPDVTAIEATIGTHPALTEVDIYDDNGYLTGKTVVPNSNWYTNEEMQINGTKYYRIATDQWLKADDVYLYQNNPVYLRTYSDSVKHLVNSQNLELNRELAIDSNWYSDRYAYFDDQKYYRLATNEWVKASDVYEYTPTDQIVQTTSSAKLFDDRGNLVRTIADPIGLKTDKIATINGIKMYRVATNEWLPISETK